MVAVIPCRPEQHRGRIFQRPLLAVFSAGLAVFSGVSWLCSVAPASNGPAGGSAEAGDLQLTWAPLEFFAKETLTQKGVRKNADSGQPSDASKSLYKDGRTSVGSWSCTAGGFPVPERSTTEVFYIFRGEGTLTDSDGTVHPWKAGDTVVLPKGWSGRWDIAQEIHKVFVVVNHPNVEETSTPIRAVVASGDDVVQSKLESLGVRKDADRGKPCGLSRKLYTAGPVKVGAWGCSDGGFPTIKRPTTEVFYVIEGLFFLTNADGTSRRVSAGDTVVLPKGWTGRWDILEPIRKVFVVVAD
eukprot:TRINITY_DN33807_c0_g1_i1.p1 TRINITY_DN33807_c0_g1~~TRINITY_DN33807_c0_g1_i1.p1  ORF type:complete len:299 (+),score=25.08 TRINITY_DN33807_c0_g1_i1:89-985(+)